LPSEEIRVRVTPDVPRYSFETIFSLRGREGEH
jgi:hypothetical protein